MVALTCRSTDIDYPYCYSYMVPGISVGWFSCASTYFSEFVEFDTTFVGEDDGRTWSKVYNTGASDSELITDVTTNAFHTGAIAAASSSTGSSNSSPSSSSKSKSSTPIGAIIGGVVGGLAVIGLAAGGILFLLLRRRNRSNNGQTATSGVTTVGAPPPEGQAPSVTEQQQTQSVYGAPGGYQPLPQTEGLAASYYGKQGQSPNVHQGGFDTAAAKMQSHISQHEVQPPLSPAPPYSQPAVAAGGISPAGSPPPNVQELNGRMGANQMQPQYAPQQQGMHQPMGGVAAVGGPPPMQYQQHQAQELPTQYATTLHTAEGQPIYEAPDQVYRSVQ